MINRVFITGDKHGNFQGLPQWCEENRTTTNDILIILGDNALRFEGANTWREIRRKELVAAQPITIFALRGNHDRPYHGKNSGGDVKLKVCPLLDQTTVGGIKFYTDHMWHDEKYPNIWYFQDGGEYCIKGKTFFTYGGAYSVDKEYRQLMHWTWYEDEVSTVSDEDHLEILDAIDHKRFNYVLTHTCPMEWRPIHLFMSGLDQSKVDTTMEERLSEILQYIGGYDHWYFGHYHADEDYGKNGPYEWYGESHMLYNEIKEIL